jgi:hypothetical protein
MQSIFSSIETPRYRRGREGVLAMAWGYPLPFSDSLLHGTGVALALVSFQKIRKMLDNLRMF